MQVPFLDLKAQYLSIEKEVDAALKAVLEKTAFAGGPFVVRFEENFARYCQTGYCIGVSSGTAALWTALLALDIGPGDEVITVPHTFIATAEAVSLCGAKPVFVDIDPKTYLMDPEAARQAITSKTRAIIPVHLYGQMTDMDRIMTIARENNLYVVEDACQAHGATYKGKKAGSIGDAGCFSFYPGKNLGAYGEAGAVITNNEKMAIAIKMIRDHGQSQKYYHDRIGWNGRMDGIQGAILDVKLKHLENWTEARRKNAALYQLFLKDIEEIVLPVEPDYNRHVYHLFVIRTQQRDALLNYLKEKEIFCGIHYPIPLHLTGAYQTLSHPKGTYKETEKAAEQILSLPMFPELSEEQITYAAEQIKTFYRI